MTNFWDYNVWGTVNLVAVLLLSLIVANILKKSVGFLRDSLIPTSVIGGMLLLAISIIYGAVTGKSLFNTEFFGGDGDSVLEIITYHSLALGFIATIFKPSREKHSRERNRDIFNTGVTTVSAYLVQAVLGLGITILASLVSDEFFPAAGALLPFGYGQGTGQAMNYGSIYETDYGFVGGKSFGLTIAALGFLSAAIGGVIHLAILKRRGGYDAGNVNEKKLVLSDIQGEDEIPMNGSMDKMSVQLALVLGTYLGAYLIMLGLGTLLPSMRSVLYGFNFLLGVLVASLVKLVMNTLGRKKVVKKQYINEFLMNRISGFFFDLMIVAGIAAIKIELLEGYWAVILILGIVGAVSTYFYVRFVCKRLFGKYSEEQFLAMYGMLTGTASTGIILLREIDGEFETPAAENLVLQNFPAIIFGFPLMFLATFAPKEPLLTLCILVVFFAVMNIILFRSYIFKRKKTE